MKKTILITLIMLVWLLSGCAGTTGPIIPPDPPNEQELADLIGDWSGLTETTTGLWDKIDLDFYIFNDNLIVSFYLNDTYVDDVGVHYDGDLVSFSSYNLMGEYAEFTGIIDHEDLIFSGDFFYQSGLSYTEGTFVIYKS